MRQPIIFAPVPFPTPVREELVETLQELHASEPFGPYDVRATARRVVDAAADLGLEPMMVRGRVDVGGAELDHVFVVVDPCGPFASTIRAWVAGDLDLQELVERAARHGLEDRVVGDYPEQLRYTGAPLWGREG